MDFFFCAEERSRRLKERSRLLEVTRSAELMRKGVLQGIG
jgi:hypothetical protein